MRTFFYLAALVSAFSACQVMGAWPYEKPVISSYAGIYQGRKYVTADELEEILGSTLMNAKDTHSWMSMSCNKDWSLIRWFTPDMVLEFNLSSRLDCYPESLERKVSFYLTLVPDVNDWEDLLFMKGEAIIAINLVQYCRTIVQQLVSRCASEMSILKYAKNFIHEVSKALGPDLLTGYPSKERIYDYGQFFVKEMPFETLILDYKKKRNNVKIVRKNLEVRGKIAANRKYLFEIPPRDENTRSLNDVLDMLDGEGPLKDPEETFLILKSLVTPEHQDKNNLPHDGYQVDLGLYNAFYQAGDKFTNLAMTTRDLLLLNEFDPTQCNRMGVVTRFNRYRELMTGEIIKNRDPLKREKRLVGKNRALYNAARKGRGTEGIEDPNVEEESRVELVEEVKVEDLESLSGDRKAVLNIIRYCRALLERFVRACTADGVTFPQTELNQQFFDQAKQLKKVSEGSWNYDEYLKYINLRLPLEEFGVKALKENTRKVGFLVIETV